MTRAKELSVPHFSDMIDLESTLRELGLVYSFNFTSMLLSIFYQCLKACSYYIASLSKLDRLMVLMRSYFNTGKEQMNISEFSQFVGISAYNPYVYNLFCLMDRVSNNVSLYSMPFVLYFTMPLLMIAILGKTGSDCYEGFLFVCFLLPIGDWFEYGLSEID